MVESVSIWAAFFAGLIAFLSPCVLPIIPGYIAYISGISVQSASQNNNRIDWSVVYAAIAFVVGFSIVFTALGAASTFVGQLLQEYKTIISKIAAVLVILLGVHFTGVFQSENVKKWLFVITGISLLIYGYGVVSTGNILMIFYSLLLYPSLYLSFISPGHTEYFTSRKQLRSRKNLPV